MKMSEMSEHSSVIHQLVLLVVNYKKMVTVTYKMVMMTAASKMVMVTVTYKMLVISFQAVDEVWL